MKKIWMMMTMLLSTCMLVSCKTDTHEALTYLDQFMVLALEDFEERINYERIDEIYYLYCYALPKDEELGDETRFFDFAIRYEDENEELKYDLLRVYQEVGEEPYAGQTIGAEIFMDYSTKQMKDLLDSNQRQYSILKAFSIKFILERGYVDSNKISEVLSR